MLHLEPGLYVRVQELPNGPKPMPLHSGFNADTAYRALGMFNPSETSDAYFILSNDRNETWFICNRHLRTVAIAQDSLAFRRPLQDFQGLNPCENVGAGSEALASVHTHGSAAPGYLMAPRSSI